MSPPDDRDDAEKERLAAERAKAMGIDIRELYGDAPVQGLGTFDDQSFYFRARHEEWSFKSWAGDADYGEVPGSEMWSISDYYGTDHAASYMPLDEAIAFICRAVEQFRAERDGLPEPHHTGD